MTWQLEAVPCQAQRLLEIKATTNGLASGEAQGGREASTEGKSTAADCGQGS